jgi:hypothetical protein
MIQYDYSFNNNTGLFLIDLYHFVPIAYPEPQLCQPSSEATRGISIERHFTT